MPLGERPGFWTPSTVGSNFEITPILKPIEKFRQHVTVVSELRPRAFLVENVPDLPSWDDGSVLMGFYDSLRECG